MDVRRMVATLALAVGGTLPATLWAQDFRVDTDVYVDDGREPASETLTLFAEDVVYDFLLTGPEVVTVFDVARGRILLLDASRQLKTTLTTDQLLEFSAAIKSVASSGGQETLFDPQFETRFDESDSTIEMTSDRLTYRAKGITPKVGSAVERFQAFADWYARLNAVRPGNVPPFGRIELNQALAQHRLVPEEIERTIVLERPLANRQLRARSHHSFIWTLSGTDRKRMEKAGRQVATFEAVTPTEYWRVSSVASKND